jgi:S1-C subfamily serine protease
MSLAAVLALMALTLGVAGQKEKPALPEEMKGAKIYHLPSESPTGVSVENLAASRRIAYKDINTERLLLNFYLALQPVDRDATVHKIYFQNVRVGGFPVHLEPFNQEFKLSKTQVVDLPAPIECSIVYSDLDSLAPLKDLVEQDKIVVSGESFIEIKVNSVQKFLLRGRQVVVPVKFNKEVPLQMFSNSPFLRLAAGRVLDALADPAAAAAMSIAREHVTKLTLENRLSSAAKNSVYMIYCKYALRNPQTGTAESFSESGTGFVISEDGKLVTAKRVIQPWKFDAQIAFLMNHYHLELDEKSYTLAAWPAGAQILGTDGRPDFAAGSSDANQTLRVIKTPPDKFETVNYQDPDSGEKEDLKLHVSGENDVAILALTGDKFQPLALADSSASLAVNAAMTLLAYPYGLSQGEAEPKQIAAQASRQDAAITIAQPLEPGESGAPLVDNEGKVWGVASGSKVCIPIENIRSLIP